MQALKPYLFEAYYSWILDSGMTPYVTVRADIPGVIVPMEFVQDHQITLNLSPSAISNWVWDKQAIGFSARFSGVSKNIVIPINAVLAIFARENGQGTAFAVVEADAGASIENDDSAEVESSSVNRETPSEKKSHLKIIK